jgi:hypothetical protein
VKTLVSSVPDMPVTGTDHRTPSQVLKRARSSPDFDREGRP